MRANFVSARSVYQQNEARNKMWSNALRLISSSAATAISLVARATPNLSRTLPRSSGAAIRYRCRFAAHELETSMGSSVRCQILAPWHNNPLRPGSAAALLLVATVLLVAAPMARGAEDVARPWPNFEAGAYRVRVEPSAKEFAPPNPPDVSTKAGHEIDALYHQLVGPQSGTSRFRARAPGFEPRK